MNLANKLTLFRVILVPFFVGSLLMGQHLIALIIFAVASLTDMLDGKIARKYNMITDFGKFLDPLADKILVAAALICMVEMGYTYAWAVWLIIAREFMVSGVRLVAAGSKEKLVIAANIWGKLKTAFTMIALVGIMFLMGVFGMSGTIFAVNEVLIWISAVLTVISGAIYLKGYWEYIDSSK